MAMDYSSLIEGVGKILSLEDNEEYVVLDVDSRTFKFGKNFNKIIAMASDENSEEITFLCPKQIEGYPVYEKIILGAIKPCIKWRHKISGNEGSAELVNCQEANDVNGQPENMQLSWIIDKNVARTAGTLEFSIGFYEYLVKPVGDWEFNEIYAPARENFSIDQKFFVNGWEGTEIEVFSDPNEVYYSDNKGSGITVVKDGKWQESKCELFPITVGDNFDHLVIKFDIIQTDYADGNAIGAEFLAINNIPVMRLTGGSGLHVYEDGKGAVAGSDYWSNVLLVKTPVSVIIFKDGQAQFSYGDKEIKLTNSEFATGEISITFGGGQSVDTELQISNVTLQEVAQDESSYELTYPDLDFKNGVDTKLRSVAFVETDEPELLRGEAKRWLLTNANPVENKGDSLLLGYCWQSMVNAELSIGESIYINEIDNPETNLDVSIELDPMTLNSSLLGDLTHSNRVQLNPASRILLAEGNSPLLGCVGDTNAESITFIIGEGGYFDILNCDHPFIKWRRINKDYGEETGYASLRQEMIDGSSNIVWTLGREVFEQSGQLELQFCGINVNPENNKIVQKWQSAIYTYFIIQDSIPCEALDIDSFVPVPSRGDNQYIEASYSEVVLPYAVSIKPYAFYGDKVLTSVSIPRVASIGDYAFYGASNLLHIYYQDGTKEDWETKVAKGTFWDGAVGSYTVHCSDGNIEVTDLVFTPINTKTCSVTGIGGYKGTDLVIPETAPDGRTVTSIGESAFANAKELYSVAVPNTVQKIGPSAFAGCSEMVEITLPKGLKILDAGVLSGCSSLTNIIIPDGLTEICSGALANCTGLTEMIIPNTVEKIGQSAFTGCDNLEKMTIPFVGMNKSNSGDDRSAGLFGFIFGASDYEEHPTYVPASLKEVQITQDCWINICAFAECGNIEKIALPYNPIGIGANAFMNCYNLEFTTYDDCIYLGNTINPYVALIDCGDKEKDSYNIHENTKIIADSAFSAKKLLSVTIPDGVTVIGESAFYECDQLVSAVLGKGITTISDRLFDNCRNLETVEYSDNLTTIGERAFFGCASLDNFDFKEGIRHIGAEAFYGSGISTVYFPDSLIEIGKYCFFNCQQLNGFLITNHPTLPEGLIGQCPVLEVVSFDGTLAEWEKLEKEPGWNTGWNDTYFISCDDGQITKEGQIFYDRDDTNCLIGAISNYYGERFHVPETSPSGKTVVGFKEYGFAGLTNLTSVTIDDFLNISIIENYAFYKCALLTSIENIDRILAREPKPTIGPWAFWGAGVGNDTIQEAAYYPGLHEATQAVSEEQLDSHIGSEDYGYVQGTSKVGVYVVNNFPEIVLLEDETLNGSIGLVDCKLNLAGKILTLSNEAMITTYGGSVIEGVIPGSEIIYTHTEDTQYGGYSLVNVRDGSVTVIGGKYCLQADKKLLSSQESVATIFNLKEEATGVFVDCELSVKQSDKNAQGNHCCIFSSAGSVELENAKLLIDDGCGIRTATIGTVEPEITIRGSKILGQGREATAIYSYYGWASLEHCLIRMNTSYETPQVFYGKKLTMAGCNVLLSNTAIGTNTGPKAFVIESGGEATIEYSNIITTTIRINNTAILTWGGSSLTMNSVYIYAGAATGKCYCLDCRGKATLKNSRLYADAHLHSAYVDNIEGYATCLLNNGTLELENCEIYGTHSGISNNSTLYINGGTYTGTGHGGIYFNNKEKSAYVANATIAAVPYLGQFRDTFYDELGHLRGAFYIGGGEGSNNIKAYLDNCIIENYDLSGTEQDSYYEYCCAFILRGTSGEINNELYISNSTMEGSQNIRLDNKTLKIYAGAGMNEKAIESMIIQTGSWVADSVIQTNEVYTKPE